MMTPLQRTFDLLNVTRILKQSGPGMAAPVFGSTPLVSAGVGGVSATGWPTLPPIALDGQDLQCFFIYVKNNGGTIQHKIISDLNQGNWGAWQYKIRGLTDPTRPFVTTPTIDSTHAHAGGGGLVSGSPHIFSLDTGPQDVYKFAGIANVGYYNAGLATKHLVCPGFAARNVNGITHYRLEFTFLNAFTAAAFNLSTSNIPSGNELDFHFLGFLA